MKSFFYRELFDEVSHRAGHCGYSQDHHDQQGLLKVPRRG
ncbi:hypothetical protein TPY_0452 [Sulfobacillus acidophilus TPY]|nr:hypothetical protein TPY_0452 [Sulfobacillus acidophilus TPY]